MSTTATVGAALMGSGAVTGLITWWSSKGTQEASTAAIITDAAKSLVEPMQNEITRLEARCAQADGRIAQLLVRVDDLLAKVALLTAETEECHRDRDDDRVRLRAVELELARYKTGDPDIRYDHP